MRLPCHFGRSEGDRFWVTLSSSYEYPLLTATFFRGVFKENEMLPSVVSRVELRPGLFFINAKYRVIRRRSQAAAYRWLCSARYCNWERMVTRLSPFFVEQSSSARSKVDDRFTPSRTHSA